MAFLAGVEAFLDFAKSRSLSATKIKCPCVRCKNRTYCTPDEVRGHLHRKGFVLGYHDWRYHDVSDEGSGRMEFVVEEDEAASTSDAQENHEESYVGMVHDAYASTFPEVHHDPSQPFLPEEPNPHARHFIDMMNAANTPLYEGCETFTQLSMIGRMTNMKASYNCPERFYDEICATIRDALPQPNQMTTGFYDTKKQIAALGLPVERIHCCVRGCMIYWGSTINYDFCRVCGECRWKAGANGEGMPRKEFFYLPLAPRLQRLYASKVTAGQMRWHNTHFRKEGEMCHPSDSEAWLNFNDTHPDFAAEPRNVRLGLCTDGFDPFGFSGTQYSSWPVIVTPYNLPPWMCMKRPYMFLTIITPGPSSPGQNIDIYLEPLIEELKMLWNDGVITWDSATSTNFRLRAALMWTISDFPAYSMLSGWSTHGKNACPHCRTNSEAIYLKYSRKMSWFDCHRVFLPDNHPFRRDMYNFLNRRVTGRAPVTASGVELAAELKDYGMLRVMDEDAHEYNRRFGPQTGGWKKRSIFWDLPYWESNTIRHCLDVMHIEKNVFDNIFNTVLRVDGKTKDHMPARCDLMDLGIRSTLHPNNNAFPAASYTLDAQKMKILLDWLKTVRFPDGFVSDLARNLNMKKHKAFGMKSHDCHVWMQRLLPVAFRELLPQPIWEALTELSLFFKALTSPKLVLADLAQLETNIPVILCKLEKIFPPSLFDCMEHLPVHLPYEARVAGPVQYRWMYPFER